MIFCLIEDYEVSRPKNKEERERAMNYEVFHRSFVLGLCVFQFQMISCVTKKMLLRQSLQSYISYILKILMLLPLTITIIPHKLLEQTRVVNHYSRNDGGVIKKVGIRYHFFVVNKIVLKTQRYSCCCC